MYLIVKTENYLNRITIKILNTHVISNIFVFNSKNSKQTVYSKIINMYFGGILYIVYFTVFSC